MAATIHCNDDMEEISTSEDSPKPQQGVDTLAVVTEPIANKKPTPRLRPLPYSALFRYADGWDYLCLVLGLVGAIGNGILMPLFTVIFGDILNAIGLNILNPDALSSQVATTVPKFMYLGIAAFVGSIIQTFCLVAPSVRQVNRLRSAFLRRVMHQDISYFDTDGTAGAMLQGLNEDCLAVQAAIGERLSMFVFMMSTALAGLTIAFIRGWQLTFVIVSLLPVLALTGYGIGVLVQRLTSSMNRAYTDANSLAQQALGNVRTVYAYNGEERTVQDYDAALQGPMKVGIKQGFYAGVTTGMANLVAYSGYALAMWFGSKKVAEGEYDGGQVLNVMLSALIGGFALGQALPHWQDFGMGQIAAARLKFIMERQPGIDIDAPGQEPSSVEGNVEFRNVAFAYPSRPDKSVFVDFSLSVPAGKTVALVGESGTGKSTVIQLIERFYDPHAGSVLLDGVDLRQLSLKWLPSQVGLVSQEPTLFATTIRHNILLGKPGASEEEVISAARAANAHTFISALPAGYDTHVGEKGVQMSGGQKQRIAIARALLKDPRVLLLDEATSALDAKSERVVQAALDRLMEGRTTVVVAHRLSTVVNADAIAVVKQGRVVERGTHSQLLAADGAYATLVRMQFGTRLASQQKRQRYLDDDKTHAAELDVDCDDGDIGAKELDISGVRRVSSFPVREPSTLVHRTNTQALAASEAGWKNTQTDDDDEANQGEYDDAFEEIPLPQETTEQALEETSAPEEKQEDIPMSRLADLNRPELPALLGGLLGSTAMGLIMPMFSLVFSSLIGVFFLTPLDQVEDKARKWSLLFMAIGFGALAACIVQSFCFNFMGQRLGKRVRVLMMGALLRQEVGWYDEERNSSGILASKLSADALAVKGQFGDTMGMLTQNLVTLVAGYIIAGIYSWRMMLVVTATVPLLGIAVVIQTRLILQYVSRETETFAAANATAAEAVSSVRTVHAFNMQDSVSQLYHGQLDEPTRQSRKRIMWTGIGFGVSQFIAFGSFSLAFWYAGEEVASGRSSFVDVLKAFFAIFMAAFSISQAQLHFPDVAKGRAASKRVFAIIDRRPAIDAADPSGLRPATCEGSVELQNVTFCYPARPEAPVFVDFSLTVPAGKTVALVGESGSGKSTVIQLIERFYDPQAGSVLLDGVDLRQLNLKWLRSHVGLVSQEPVLFNMTVADNIRYGNPGATLEAAVAAAKAANADGFISALPEGYHTRLGEGAIQLSGGQKQRVAIARALLKDPRVLLLDEATSALDAESERVVQAALDRLMHGRTTLVVAHRLSTVRDADSIAVVYKGHIVEQGRHAELVAAGGAYARLVAHQLTS